MRREESKEGVAWATLFSSAPQVDAEPAAPDPSTTEYNVDLVDYGPPDMPLRGALAPRPSWAIASVKTTAGQGLQTSEPLQGANMLPEKATFWSLPSALNEKVAFKPLASNCVSSRVPGSVTFR